MYSINVEKTMRLGIDTFVSVPMDASPPALAQRVEDLIEEAETADRVGLDLFAIGEHHRPEYVASAPAVLLAAVAARTDRIRLSSAVTVLSSDDPIRVFQDFATLDLISKGRAEIIVGRGSFIESYPLFGHDLGEYDTLFAEKLDLLLKAREATQVHWSGTHRAPLTGQGVYPRPLQEKLPIRLGMGGTPASFVRAGTLGLPLTVAIIGGEPARFRPLVDLYRRAWAKAGHAGAPDVAVHGLGFVADTDEEAADLFYPGYADTMNRIGRERGWPPTSRARFEAALKPDGSLMVGSPKTVARRVRAADEALGGISGFTLKLDEGGLAHGRMLRAVELMGTRVKPMLEAVAV